MIMATAKMDIEPHGVADTAFSSVVAVVGIIVGWLEPSKLLILMSLAVATVTLIDRVITLRRRLARIEQ